MDDFFNHHAISWRKIPLDWFGGKLFSLRFYTTYNSNENDNDQWKNRTTPLCFPLKNEIVSDTIAHEILTTRLTSLQVSNQKCCCRWHFLPYHHFHALSLSLSLSLCVIKSFQKVYQTQHLSLSVIKSFQKVYETQLLPYYFSQLSYVSDYEW